MSISHRTFPFVACAVPTDFEGDPFTALVPSEVVERHHLRPTTIFCVYEDTGCLILQPADGCDRVLIGVLRRLADFLEGQLPPPVITATPMSEMN